MNGSNIALFIVNQTDDFIIMQLCGPHWLIVYKEIWEILQSNTIVMTMDVVQALMPNN